MQHRWGKTIGFGCTTQRFGRDIWPLCEQNRFCGQPCSKVLKLVSFVTRPLILRNWEKPLPLIRKIQRREDTTEGFLCWQLCKPCCYKSHWQVCALCTSLSETISREQSGRQHSMVPDCSTGQSWVRRILRFLSFLLRLASSPWKEQWSHVQFQLGSKVLFPWPFFSATLELEPSPYFRVNPHVPHKIDSWSNSVQILSTTPSETGACKWNRYPVCH